ncbi:MAG: hypothetical protein WCJ66_02970 [Verrucomicrobiota bacterium]
MTLIFPTRNLLQSLTLPIAVLALSAWQALPTITEAWSSDLYARGAPLACAIWLIPQIWWRVSYRHSPIAPRTAWLGLAVLLCIAGAMTELRVVQHLALACALAGTFGWRFSGFVTIATSLAWLPASGWFVSHWKNAGLAGWERPVLASSLGVFLLVRARCKRQSFHVNSHQP